MTLTDPKLTLEFLGNDLAEGHSTTQTLGDVDLVRHSFIFKEQRFNGLKSSSDTISFQLVRRCSATEDIIATEGDIRATLEDGDTAIFTGYVSTNFSWSVTDHGEQVLNISLESVGTRLFNKAFIETGKYFFDCTASAAVYNIIHPLGISLREGDERKLLQNVKKCVEGGTTCRDLMDQLCYECNAVYWFNNLGELCIQEITADTTGVPVYDSANLLMKDRKVVNLSKKLRTYKGARVAYDEVSSAQGYLIYRNTTNASATRVCNIELPGGNYFDGAEIYTAQEWAEATADEFREPTLISAVNAASESSIVGSNEILNISNLTPNVVKDADIDFSAETVGGPYFKLLAHNTALTTKAITRMDLYADIVYVKSHGVIRTQIDGISEGKSTLEEELSWIHDRENASRHANLLAQYHKSAGSTYTFYCNESIPLGSVIKLNDDVYSGLEVYVLVTARQSNDKEDCCTYTAVGISTFDLGEDAYHGTTEPAKQSGAQGPQGEPGATAEVQYAIGDSIINPPGDAMQWASADMLWGGQTMFWNTGTWEEEVPTPERGKYIWMRTRIGDAPWQYTRLTGATAWDPSFLGLYDSTTGAPTHTADGLGIIAGDCFTALESWDIYSKGITYTYTGSGWIPAGTDNPTMLLQALSAMKEQGVDFNNLNDPNTISWFATIISDTVIARTIKAIQGFFDSIYVTGDSQFDGNIFNEAFQTYKGSNGATLSFTSPSGSVFLPKSSVMSELGSYGTYIVTSGSITVKKEHTSTDYTYTATSSSPLAIIFTSADFKIKKLSNSSIVVRTNSYNSILETYQLVNPTLGTVEITANSLVLANTAASAEVSLLIPKNSSSSVGSASLPFSKGWFGSFASLITGTGDSKTTGHCSLTNGLELKWGYINGTENDGVYSFSHTYSSDEGGPFATTTLFAHAEVPVGTVACRVVTDVPGPSYNPEKKFEIKKYNLANTSTYTAGVFIRWFAIGY